MEEKAVGLKKLRVYRLANDLWLNIQRWTKAGHWRGSSYLADQINRASHSVPSNIAEGYSRGSNGDFIRFLNIAKGSATELKHHLAGAKDLGLLEGEDAEAFLDQSDAVERMLSKLIKYRKELEKKKPKKK